MTGGMAGRDAPVRVQMPDGATLAVWDTGEADKPALLLVSGLGGTAAFWSACMADLARTFRVIRFDQRGIGASARGQTPCTIETLARDTLAVLEGLGVERAVVLGHSTGGCIAQALAQLAPARLAGLVLSATWGRQNRYMTALFSTRLALLHHDPHTYAASACLLAFPPAWLEAHWDVFETSVARAPASPEAQTVVAERIEALLAFEGPAVPAGMPTLILGAEDDMIVPPFLQRELASAMPQALLVMFDSGGHFFPISRPGDVAREVASSWRKAS
jgi:aminoacrylate hydrolase